MVGRRFPDMSRTVGRRQRRIWSQQDEADRRAREWRSQLAARLQPGDTVKALSLWEPWATLMALGCKQVETRHWPTSYRGPLLICAAKRWAPDQVDYLADPLFQEALSGLAPGRPITPDDLNMGHAVALVDLVECRQVPSVAVRSDDRGPKTWLDRLDPREDEFGNLAPGSYGWITEHPRRLRPFPQLGQQGLFEVTLPRFEDWSES